MKSKLQSRRQSEETKVLEVDPIFARFDKPLYLELHTLNQIWLGTAHIFAAWHIYECLFGDVKTTTLPFELIYGYIGGLGTTVGCHRYWSHKTFKATLPLQILLMIMQIISNQWSIRKWCRDHRIHHKYTDTDADPHNSKRGFWFCHMGWLFLPRHPEFQKKLNTFRMPDLDNDPIVRFQSKWYWTLTIIFHFIIPISIIHFFFGLTWMQSIGANYRRYVVSLHVTWSVNSFAHMFGDKPYDRNISSRENRAVSFVAIGEGWHNYHHVFPFDYQASEFGWKLNFSTMFIDLCAYLGLASDLKTVSHKLLRERLLRTGDGSRTLDAPGDHQNANDGNGFNYSTAKFQKASLETPVWGWDDDKIPNEFRNITKILSPERNK